jgi:cytochrome c oxidase subunit 3
MNMIETKSQHRLSSAIASVQGHPYHLVEISPWPIFSAFSVFSLAFNTALINHGYIGSQNAYLILLSFICVIYSISLWGRDIVAEATILGHHTLAVRNGIYIGYILFIVSEVMFFVGIFWAYAHSSLSPNIELGSEWPPLGITAIGPMELPLLNTIILLSSGATITYSHHALIANKYNTAIYSLLITVVLAFLFVICQYIEYLYASFTIADGVYGSCFYFGTGCHGYHILVGFTMLSISLWRMINYHYTDTHHLGYETTILLWHFLDVVWLFLFILFYWWGS